jgi:hypothetical protein
VIFKVVAKLINYWWRKGYNTYPDETKIEKLVWEFY